MKKTIAFTAICCSALLSSAQNQVSLHATIKGMEAGQWVYLSPMSNSLQTDSVQTTAGGFQATIPILEGEGDAYIVKIGRKYTDGSMALLYLDKGAVELKGEGPLLKDVRSSGSKSIQDYNDYKEFTTKDPVLKGRAELYRKANELYAKKDSAGLAALEPELNRTDSIDKALTKQWIGQHPASPISAFLLGYNLGRLPLDEKETLLAKLSPAAKDNGPAKRLLNSIRINNLTGIGKTALDFTQNDTLGKPVSLKDFRGKYVLVDFWASWCVPCRAENPNVVSAFQKYKDRDFTVLSVSLDQPNGKEKWMKAIHDDHLEWTHVSDLKFWNNAVAKTYDINSIPSNLLLDPEGKIIAKDLHGEELGETLAKVLPATGATGATRPTEQALQAGPFTLSGIITGQASGKLKLFYTDKDGRGVQDSSLIKEGRFEFKGVIAEPQVAYLQGAIKSRDMNDPNAFDFFLEPAPMTISLKANDFKHAVITGSKSQDEYRELQQLKAPIYKEMEPLSKKYAAASEAYRQAVKAKKSDAIIDTLKYRAAAIHDQFDPYHARAAREEYKFFAAHPQSYVTAFTLRFHVTDLSLDSLQLFYDGLGSTVQQSSSGKEVAKEIAQLRAGSPGSLAADFTATELNGTSFSLSSLKGKYVLIDFWASWCVPCRKSMPHVKELYDRYKDKGFEVVAVSDDDRDSSAWKKAIAKDGTGIWHNVLRGLYMEKAMKREKNDRDISDKFGIHSLPTKILIDPSGTIIGRYDKGTEEEAAAMDKKIAEALGKG